MEKYVLLVDRLNFFFFFFYKKIYLMLIFV